MKKSILKHILLLFFVFPALTLQAEKKEITHKTINLTKQVFLSKIFNYEKNPDQWTYLNDKPCLIDFYASWCGPCKNLSPVLEELAAEYGDKIYIYKINIDKEKELAATFGIQSIPLLLFCPMSENPQALQGAHPKETIKKAIDMMLLKKKSQKTEN